MKPKRFHYRKYWKNQGFMGDGRWPIPGLDLYFNITDETSLEEFLHEWKSAYEDVRQRAIRHAEGSRDQPTNKR